jgi:hypothetical protein
MIEITTKWLVALALLMPGASGTAMARQNSGSDIPKSKPRSNNPDMQPQTGQNSGRAVPNAGGSANQSSTQSTKGGKREKKKPHNPQTHNAQKHNPSNQS